MPSRSRGPRIATTVRMPYDEYREMARRARARGWSMSDYIAYCVAQQVRVKGKRGGKPATAALKASAYDAPLSRFGHEPTDEELGLTEPVMRVLGDPGYGALNDG
ncbi:MAG TPA: hypothetical protein VIX41_01255 [Acidimicrobiales bacterium]